MADDDCRCGLNSFSPARKKLPERFDHRRQNSPSYTNNQPLNSPPRSHHSLASLPMSPKRPAPVTKPEKALSHRKRIKGLALTDRHQGFAELTTPQHVQQPPRLRHPSPRQRRNPILRPSRFRRNIHRLLLDRCFSGEILRVKGPCRLLA